MLLSLVVEHLKMEEKLSKKLVKLFVLATKVLPITIAVIHFINIIISYFYINDIMILNYIGGISILTILYLYLASYTFKLCEYYRMFLYYSVIMDIINIYDYYIGIPITDIYMFMLSIIITIITMFVVIYLKFFK